MVPHSKDYQIKADENDSLDKMRSESAKGPKYILN